MAITPVTTTIPQTQQAPAPAGHAASNASQESAASPADTGSEQAESKPKADDAVKVSLSDSATKLLAANKKVNADGTVGPHHKPRHPQAATKPV
jgi:hypothetical protein